MKRALQDLKILCVEDEANISKLLKEAIGEYFYSFTIAKDGIEGIEKFQIVNPDIVITDIMMPRLDGLEMSKKIKDIDENISIIILSAYSEKEKLLQAIDLGITKYFIKPFDPDKLLEYLSFLARKLSIQKMVCLNRYFSFDLNTKTLFENEKRVKLTKREELFLYILAKSHDNFISLEKMKQELWEEENISLQRIRTFIKRLRKKCNKELIKNITGQGYLISKENI
jgi:DNA-binding response OmpR family regulator